MLQEPSLVDKIPKIERRPGIEVAVKDLCNLLMCLLRTGRWIIISLNEPMLYIDTNPFEHEIVVQMHTHKHRVHNSLIFKTVHE